MRLAGSCHCGAVRFEVESEEPTPFLRCYCSICRKTAGSGGYGINLGAKAASLSVEGAEHIRRYDAASRESGVEAGDLRGRRFCGRCGSPLWNFDPSWPDLVHPHAGAIDTDLPVPPERTHMMLGSAANWVQPDTPAADKQFNAYPDESLAAWHKRIKDE